ncbi:MAG: bifunctional diaminohydroxyphosphoribosylaminopyrimidine deaminase/5-amino-6-(5-phosphoribosylamino)uracil reductase RibD [Candidatus Omnitrophica bacterium]|nr:bifunctional diaminohydroxyphosphoribosylaminopyrimidine deaminase/5-amino-6-(5-phosphoribosylamino)uracil reductase RibD [Candidatus Omnitrophota bacterium]
MNRLNLNSTHELLMKKALQIAELGRGKVSPNPLVGALLVKNGNIVGRGAHLRFGGVHAEINALHSAGARARGAYLYVTLEPCSSWGKTGPCADAIVRSGVSRVFIGAMDPNPVNHGKGIRILQRAGLKVVHGILADQVLRQNAGFTSLHRKGRPYAILKMAQSLDGKIATSKGESKWITGEKTRAFVHRLRTSVDAILVGTNTILRDNPSLTARFGVSNKMHPARIIMDRKLRMGTSTKVLKANEAPVFYATSSKNVSLASTERLAKRAEVIGVREKGRGLDLKQLLKKLGRKGITSILVEGGGELAASFLKEKLVDEVYWCIAPIFVGGRNSKTSVEGRGIARLKHAYRLKDVKIRRIGNDIIVKGKF